MKRTPLKRKTRLRSGSVLAKRNRKRAAMRKERDFGEYAEWIREQPCCVSGRRTGDIGEWLKVGIWTKTIIEAAHVKSRGAGGVAKGNLVPLDWMLHLEQHRIGIKSFQAKYGIDLAGVASALAARWKEEMGE